MPIVRPFIQNRVVEKVAKMREGDDSHTASKEEGRELEAVDEKGREEKKAHLQCSHSKRSSQRLVYGLHLKIYAGRCGGQLGVSMC